MIQQTNRNLRTFILMLLLFSSITLLFGQTPDSSRTVDLTVVDSSNSQVVVDSGVFHNNDHWQTVYLGKNAGGDSVVQMFYTNPWQVYSNRQLAKNGGSYGPYKVYSRSGKLRMEGWVENGSGEGPYKVYTQAGALRKIGNYLHGKDNGMVYEWDDDSVCTHTTYVEGKREGPYSRWKGKHKIFQTYYTHDVKNGLETYWTEKGNKQSEDHYVNGVREGMSRHYYRNGKLMEEEMMHNGLKDGLCTYWHKSGKKDYEREYVKGVPDGVEIYWNSYGQKTSEIHYKQGKRNGLSTIWDSGSSKKDYYKQSEMQYVNDQVDGSCSYWFPNGQIQLIEEYKAGRKVGVVDQWLENGKRLKMACDTTYYYNDPTSGIASIIYYSNKIKNGASTLFDEHGKRQVSVNYVQGRKEGMQQSWYPNGVLSCEGNYKDGKRNGLFKTWDCKGRLAFEVQFNNDKLDKVTYFTTSKGLKALQYPTPPLTEFEEDDYSQMSKAINGEVPVDNEYPNSLNPHYALVMAYSSGGSSVGYNFPHQSGMMYARNLLFVKTDKPVLIQSLEQLKEIFAPIESESEAISYAELLTSKYALDSIVLPKDAEVYQENVLPTYAKKEAKGYRVLLFDYDVFGCGPHMHYTCEYLVTFSGKVTLISKKNFYTNPRDDGLCVD